MTRNISVGRGIGVMKIFNLNSWCFSRKLSDDGPLWLGRGSSSWSCRALSTTGSTGGRTGLPMLPVKHLRHLQSNISTSHITITTVLSTASTVISSASTVLSSASTVVTSACTVFSFGGTVVSCACTFIMLLSTVLSPTCAYWFFTFSCTVFLFTCTIMVGTCASVTPATIFRSSAMAKFSAATQPHQAISAWLLCFWCHITTDRPSLCLSTFPISPWPDRLSFTSICALQIFQFCIQFPHVSTCSEYWEIGHFSQMFWGFWQSCSIQTILMGIWSDWDSFQTLFLHIYIHPLSWCSAGQGISTSSSAVPASTSISSRGHSIWDGTQNWKNSVPLHFPNLLFLFSLVPITSCLYIFNFFHFHFFITDSELSLCSADLWVNRMASWCHPGNHWSNILKENKIIDYHFMINLKTF